MSGLVRRNLLAGGGAAVALMLMAGGSYAGDAVEVSIIIKDHKFEPSTLKVPAGKPFVLKVDNQDAAAEEFECKKLNIEKLIAANSTGIVRVRALKPGTYEFVGEFHEDTAKGTMVAE